MMTFLLYVVGGLIVYTLIGSLTVQLWNHLSPRGLLSDDEYAVWMLWWVFMPIGLSMKFMEIGGEWLDAISSEDWWADQWVISKRGINHWLEDKKK